MAGDITVRLWSDNDLKKIKTDKKLATVFMNGHSFSEREMAHYPYEQRREYYAVWEPHWDGDEFVEPETITFYATDDKTARWFLEQQYAVMPDDLTELITKSRPVKMTIRKVSRKKTARKTNSGLGGTR